MEHVSEVKSERDTTQQLASISLPADTFGGCDTYTYDIYLVSILVQV